MKQILFFLVFAAMMLVAAHCPAPTYPNWATTNQAPVPVNSTTVYVAPNGNDATGLRGTAYPFATPSAATAVMQSGDSLTILPGQYTDNTALSLPKNAHVDNYGQIFWGYINPASGLTPQSIYIKPADNLVFNNYGSITCTTSNKFNCVFGTSTNSPPATNWLVTGLVYNHSDSDGLYFSQSNGFACQGIMRGVYLDTAFWDTFATLTATANGNNIEIDGFDFDCNYTNGAATPAGTRGINIQSPGTYIFKNGRIKARRPGTTNHGVEEGGGAVTANVVLSGISFDISGSLYVDIVQTATNAVIGCGTVSGLPLNIVQSGISVPGPPIEISSPLIALPSSSLANQTDFGQWSFSDPNDFGAVYITNGLASSALSSANGNSPGGWFPSGYGKFGGNFATFDPNFQGGLWADNLFCIHTNYGLTFQTYPGGSYNGNGSGLTNLITAPSGSGTNIVGEIANGNLVPVGFFTGSSSGPTTAPAINAYIGSSGSTVPSFIQTLTGGITITNFTLRGDYMSTVTAANMLTEPEMPIPSGTYTNFIVDYTGPTLGAGTNVIIMLLTNGVASGYSVTIKGPVTAGTRTIVANLTGSLLVLTNTAGALQVTNNSTTSLSLPFLGVTVGRINQ